MADLLDIAGVRILRIDVGIAVVHDEELRSEEHTSELQCQISYAVFCLKKKHGDTVHAAGPLPCLLAGTEIEDLVDDVGWRTAPHHPRSRPLQRKPPLNSIFPLSTPALPPL